MFTIVKYLIISNNVLLYIIHSNNLGLSMTKNDFPSKWHREPTYEDAQPTVLRCDSRCCCDGADNTRAALSSTDAQCAVTLGRMWDITDGAVFFFTAGRTTSVCDVATCVGFR